MWKGKRLVEERWKYSGREKSELLILLASTIGSSQHDESRDVRFKASLH